MEMLAVALPYITAGATVLGGLQQYSAMRDAAKSTEAVAKANQLQLNIQAGQERAVAQRELVLAFDRGEQRLDVDARQRLRQLEVDGGGHRQLHRPCSQFGSTASARPARERSAPARRGSAIS